LAVLAVDLAVTTVNLGAQLADVKGLYSILEDFFGTIINLF
jgi:hypothetical protein